MSSDEGVRATVAMPDGRRGRGPVVSIVLAARVLTIFWTLQVIGPMSNQGVLRRTPDRAPQGRPSAGAQARAVVAIPLDPPPRGRQRYNISRKDT